MTQTLTAEQLQGYVVEHVTTDLGVNYLPEWLMATGILFVLMVLVLCLHAALRFFLVKKDLGSHVHKEYLYPVTIRLWHWTNALLFITLLTTGFINHFALVTTTSMVTSVYIHKVCGFILLFIWLAFVSINLFAGNGIHYKINFTAWINRALKQVHFYLLGIIKGEGHPFPASQQSKFNPLQQAAYVGVMYGLVPLLILTGFLCLYPQLTFGLIPGYLLLLLHFLLAIAAIFFMVGHIYLCTTGDTLASGFRCMIDGYHRHFVHEEHDRQKKTGENVVKDTACLDKSI